MFTRNLPCDMPQASKGKGKVKGGGGLGGVVLNLPSLYEEKVVFLRHLFTIIYTVIKRLPCSQTAALWVVKKAGCRDKKITLPEFSI